jgi:putative DNA primase/helicase
MVYPDIPQRWRKVDRRPDGEAAERAALVFSRCASLPAGSIAAVGLFGGVPFLHFDADAQALHDDWRGKLELRLRAGEEAPVFVAHLGKFRSLVPALATIFHLADVVAGQRQPGPVSGEALRLAIRWANFLEAHARRVYGLALARGEAAARAIAKKLLDKALPSPLTARDIYHRGWAGLTDPEEVREGLDLLDDLHWLFAEPPTSNPAGGRPKVRYLINPRIWDAGFKNPPPKAPSKPAKPTPGEVLAVSAVPEGESFGIGEAAGVDL